MLSPCLRLWEVHVLYFFFWGGGRGPLLHQEKLNMFWSLQFGVELESRFTLLTSFSDGGRHDDDENYCAHNRHFR